MTDPQLPALVENLLLVRKEDFYDLLDHAAERGAKRALADVGLDGEDAAHDMRELRDLLEAFNAAKHTACPAGFWTIGYGHLCNEDHPPITEDEGEYYLTQDLQTALNATLRYCPVLATEPKNRLAAIVDFTFNLGAGRLQTSTLRRRVNQQDWENAAKELRRWVYGGGKVLPGLILRRTTEISLLNKSSQ